MALADPKISKLCIRSAVVCNSLRVKNMTISCSVRERIRRLERLRDVFSRRRLMIGRIANY